MTPAPLTEFTAKTTFRFPFGKRPSSSGSTIERGIIRRFFSTAETKTPYQPIPASDTSISCTTALPPYNGQDITIPVRRTESEPTRTSIQQRENSFCLILDLKVLKIEFNTTTATCSCDAAKQYRDPKFSKTPTRLRRRSSIGGFFTRMRERASSTTKSYCHVSASEPVSPTESMNYYFTSMGRSGPQELDAYERQKLAELDSRQLAAEMPTERAPEGYHPESYRRPAVQSRDDHIPSYSQLIPDARHELSAWPSTGPTPALTPDNQSMDTPPSVNTQWRMSESQIPFSTLVLNDPLLYCYPNQDFSEDSLSPRASVSKPNHFPVGNSSPPATVWDNGVPHEVAALSMPTSGYPMPEQNSNKGLGLRFYLPTTTSVPKPMTIQTETGVIFQNPWPLNTPAHNLHTTADGGNSDMQHLQSHVDIFMNRAPDFTAVMQPSGSLNSGGSSSSTICPSDTMHLHELHELPGSHGSTSSYEFPTVPDTPDPSNADERFSNASWANAALQNPNMPRFSVSIAAGTNLRFKCYECEHKFMDYQVPAFLWKIGIHMKFHWGSKPGEMPAPYFHREYVSPGKRSGARRKSKGKKEAGTRKNSQQVQGVNGVDIQDYSCCPHCSKVLRTALGKTGHSTLSNLLKHIKHHCKKSPKEPSQCKFCLGIFSRVCALKQHQPKCPKRPA